MSLTYLLRGPPSLYWNYALNVHVEDVVYLHCHQEESGGVIVFVGQDGVQRSPIRFPKGSHLLAFLSCLENGLQPNGQLDPPLWIEKGKGKVFPRLKKKVRQNGHRREELPPGADHSDPRTEEQAEPTEPTEPTAGPAESADGGESLRMDFVFRIVTSLDKPDIICECEECTRKFT